MSTMQFPEEKNRIEVNGSDDWNRLKFAGVLETVGLTACVGVSIYSKLPRLGFLGHFLVGNTRNLNDMLQEAKEEIRYPATAQIWVGGGSVDPFAKEKEEKAGNKDVLEYRDTVEQALEDTFGPLEGRIKRDWLDEDLCIDYSLNIRTGEIQTEIVSAKPDDTDTPPEHRLLY